MIACTSLIGPVHRLSVFASRNFALSTWFSQGPKFTKLRGSKLICASLNLLIFSCMLFHRFDGMYNSTMDWPMRSSRATLYRP